LSKATAPLLAGALSRDLWRDLRRNISRSYLRFAILQEP